jgi:hypothetical protein
MQKEEHVRHIDELTLSFLSKAISELSHYYCPLGAKNCMKIMAFIHQISQHAQIICVS